jgi:hypothetical protein
MAGSSFSASTCCQRQTAAGVVGSVTCAAAVASSVATSGSCVLRCQSNHCASAFLTCGACSLLKSM